MHNVTYGIVLPPTTETSEATEFIGEIVAPVAAQWVGIALGGAMLDSTWILICPCLRDEKVEEEGRREEGADVCGFVFVDLLLVAWPNDGDIVSSTRYAT